MLERRTLKLARGAKGLTQLALAQAVGLKEHDITRFETGRSMPMPSVALRIASILGANPNELFPGLNLSEKQIESIIGRD